MSARGAGLWTAAQRWYWRHRVALFRVLTGPGIICHELAHAVACAVFGLRIEEVEFLQLSGPAGYVSHERPHTWIQSLAVSSAPALVNTAVSLALFQFLIGIYQGSGVTAGVIVIAGVWVGLSALIHAVPSLQDVQTVWDATTRRWYRLPTAIVVYPLLWIRGRLRRVGVYRFTMPLAVFVGAGVVASHDVSGSEFVSAVTDGCWGCWETPVVARQVFEWARLEGEAAVEAALDSLLST